MIGEDAEMEDELLRDGTVIGTLDNDIDAFAGAKTAGLSVLAKLVTLTLFAAASFSACTSMLALALELLKRVAGDALRADCILDRGCCA